MKTLITFVHFHKDNDPLPKENLDFFIKLGLTDSIDHHFNFVINSKSGGDQIPDQKNASIINGHNKGYDFGAYKQSVESVDIDQFDRFIFINDTCRGPFLPTYIPKSITWVDMFLKEINEKIKIVGPTWFNASYEQWVCDSLKVPIGQIKHIQSYCFGMDRDCLKLLLKNKKFDSINKNKYYIIKDHEIGVSQFIINQGYDIKPFELSALINLEHLDINHPNKYSETTINPLEIMFIKTNRINDNIVKNYTKWMMK